MASHNQISSAKIQEKQAIKLKEIKLRPVGDSTPETFPGDDKQAALQYKRQGFTCDVPVNWRNPEDASLGNLKLSLSILTPGEKDKEGSPLPEKGPPFHSLPIVAYLCGGPGSKNNPEDMKELSQYFMEMGYQMLYLDYRGCGRSSEISNKTIKAGGRDTAQKQFEYLRHFRQDNIVRDLEAVRRNLQAETGAGPLKLTLFGQSYGGWIILTYLSFYPDGVERAYINGGLAPIGVAPKDVYARTYEMVIGYNNLFYEKYPDDVRHVRAIVAHILKEGDGIKLPGNGGYLTARRFLCTGRSLGGPQGLRDVHDKMVWGARDIEEKGELSHEWLEGIKDVFRFNDRPLYALLHEPIYQDGPSRAARWAAERAAQEEEHSKQYSWVLDGFGGKRPEDVAGDRTRLYFSGEHIYSWHYEAGMYPGLDGLGDLANEVEACEDWEYLYDIEQLSRNKVPVYALAFSGDMYVFHGYANRTAELVANTSVSWLNNMFHASIKTNARAVLKEFEKLVAREPTLTYEIFRDISTIELLKDMLEATSKQASGQPCAQQPSNIHTPS